ncbi:MAG: hypothetical protein LBM25_06345 [Bacteroidales bacterium]|jgi:carbon monoxide dehydrogenase subunit G|nr:hypothetical protein [Bacteroidales bacterium]
MKIQSKENKIEKEDKYIFDFLSDFTNFSLLLPDKVENWKATKDRCSFDVKGVSSFGMKISETMPHSSIIIVNDEEVKMPAKFVFSWNIEKQNDNSSKVYCSFDLDINPIVSSMIKKPLNDFVNILVDKLKEKMEKD